MNQKPDQIEYIVVNESDAFTLMERFALNEMFAYLGTYYRVKSIERGLVYGSGRAWKIVLVKVK